MNSNVENLVSITVIIFIFIGVTCGSVLYINAVYRDLREKARLLQRWQDAMYNSMTWFGPDEDIMAVLQNIVDFATTKHPNEFPLLSAFDLHRQLMAKRKAQLKEVFKSVADKQMKDMDSNELHSYLLGLGIDKGPTSTEFRMALGWLVTQYASTISRVDNANELLHTVKNELTKLHGSPS